MPAERSPKPPRLAEALIRRRLPEELAESITGDLVEEYRSRLLPERGRLLADLWFWGQALGLRARTLRTAYHRLRSNEPSRRVGRPRRVRRDSKKLWSRIPMQPTDFKHAARRLLKNPGFALIAVISLALGIGGNTAIFSVVNAILIRELPVEEPEELVEVYTSDSEGNPHSTSSYPDYADLRENVAAFSDVVATRTFLGRLRRGEGRDMVIGELVSWDYFQVLGVPMSLGRSFLPEEGKRPGGRPVLILGHRTWQREFGGDPGVLGRTVRLNGTPHTVVGVAPRSFSGSLPALVSGVYVPLAKMEATGGFEGQTEKRGSRALFVKARLAPGVTVERANQRLEAFSARLAERYPETNEDRTLIAVPTGEVALHPAVDRALEPAAALLLGVVGIVLLVACANLASFLLARAEDRRRETAVRLALGASRGALVRQLLVETTLLALVGGGAGVVLAHGALGLLTTFRPPVPLPVSIDLSLDRTVLLFTAGVSVLAGLSFGLLPALQATNPDVATTLKDEARREGGPRGSRTRRGLVVVQVAFSFLLLIGAGLFLLSLQKAQRIDPGFDTGPAAVVAPLPEMSGYESPEKARAFHQVYEERLLAHPAVRAVTRADRLPLGLEVRSARYRIPGVPSRRPDGLHSIDRATVAPSYFETLGVSILRGRAFRESDRRGEPAAVVSEAFVQRFFPGEEVPGRRIERADGEPLRIVGVAEDTKVRTLGEPPRPYLYHVRRDDEMPAMQVVVKGDGTGRELLGVARRVLDEVDPEMVLLDAKTMEEHLSIMLFPPRMAALLLSLFGGLALLLAAIGIYGVVSHNVARRTREMGIRISLGATAGDVIRLAVAGGMRLVLAGGLLGMALAGAVTWALEGFLYGIRPTDLATFVAIPLVLTAVALLAAFVPARRASGADPVRALRTE